MIYDIKNDDLIKIIKNTQPEDLSLLAEEIREFLLENVSQTGGHIASNLGIVELTIALHKVYNSPDDKIIFDVGHQTYVHKIITGRADKFNSLRKYGGLSGFPKSRESVHDVYDTGHSSTSLGAALGMATARDLNNQSNQVVAVIGDGSMTGGLAYEALNNIGSSGTNMNIVLNDNGMSIAKNVGGMSKYLTDLRTSSNYIKTKDTVKTTLNSIPVIGSRVTRHVKNTKDRLKYSLIDDRGVFIEELGITYIGPVYGHDIKALVDVLNAANELKEPTLVHVMTKKGKGYPYAERYPRKFHGVGPFDIDNGNLLSSSSAQTFSKVFGTKLVEMARENDSIVAITAAMGTATGLGQFYKEFPERFFDVGIAEAHAVLFAAGLAKAGMKPVVAIYSSFLQRAYDQIIEDVALQNLDVIFAVDRAGLVGADGETHHGQFDISFLSGIPGLTVLCPADGFQLREMMDYALKAGGPVAIRYPRGAAELKHLRIRPFTGNNIQLSEGSDVTILAVGTMLDTAIEAAELIREKGYSVGVQNICVVKPFSDEWHDLKTKLVVTIEDGIESGGFGDIFNAHNVHANFDIFNYALPNEFIVHGSIEELRTECGMRPGDIAKGVADYFEGEA